MRKRGKLRQERHVSQAQHVAPDGAFNLMAAMGYKHPGSYGAKTCAFSYVELTLFIQERVHEVCILE
jgi:hypothetical protein